jgi:nucleotide-binding universal stress UspA family protein
MYRHLLIAPDGSELAGKAIEQGLALAKALQAQVTIVTATEPWASAVSGELAIGFPIDEYDKAMTAHAADVLVRAQAVAKAKSVTCTTLHIKDQFPADAIVEAAKAKGCDLIVMASHGRRGLSRLLLGSQTTRVIVSSMVPVLVCR